MLGYIMPLADLADEFFIWNGILLIQRGLLADQILEIIGDCLN